MMLRFGTSSWVYPGWKGQIYKQVYSSEKNFREDSLAEYAAHSLFTTVGIDSFFYAPPRVDTLRRYKRLVGEDFKWVSKVWERFTVPHFPHHARYGTLKGKTNPCFLDAKLFREKVLQIYLEADVIEQTGPFVFQFPYIAPTVLEPEKFFQKLETFLRDLPQNWHYAIEVRNRTFLDPVYFSILNQFGVTHCFNHWSYMPTLKDQMLHAARAGGLEAPFYVSRILTPLGCSYKQAVERFAPYDTLQQPIEDMRSDVERLVKRALERNVSAYVIVNNRAEGNAPATIAALHERYEKLRKTN